MVKRGNITPVEVMQAKTGRRTKKGMFDLVPLAGSAAQLAYSRYINPSSSGPSMVQYASQVGRAVKNVSPQTITLTGKKKSSRTRGMVSNSRSAGKFYGTIGRRKIKKFKKSYKTQQLHVYELSGSNSSVKCAHLIHATHPAARMFYLYCQSLTQYSMYRMGNKISNWQDSLQDQYSWTVSYYANSGSTAILSTGQTVVASASFVTFAESIYNSLTGVIQSDTNRDILFADFVLTKDSVTEIFRMSLRDFKVRIACKSHFKIQNRSRNALGSEADEVDNVPLEGTVCDNKGSGVYLRDFNRIARPFSVQCGNGLTIVDGDSDTTKSLQEPLRRGDIVKVKKFAKIKFEPGEIKTSILSGVEVFTIQRLKNAIILIKNFDRAFTSFGESRVIGLEKMVATNAVGEGAMSIFYELQQNYYVSNKFKPANQAIKEVRHVDGVN